MEEKNPPTDIQIFPAIRLLKNKSSNCPQLDYNGLAL
jgi:hypothetical protein